MPSRMTTRSASRQTAAPRGGRTGGRTGRGGGRTREPTGRVGGQTCGQDGQVGDRGIRANGGINEVPDFSTVIAQQLSANVSNGRNDCSHKEFMTCNPKDYDGKGGAIVYTRWIKKMESVQDMSGCGANQKVKYTAGSFIDFKGLMRKESCPNNELQKLESEFWCHAMVEAGLAAYTDRFDELARLVPYLVTPENKRIERNGSLMKNTKKIGNGRGLSKDGNVRDDNKQSRTSRTFATVTNPVRKEYTGTAPKCTNCSFHNNPEIPCYQVMLRAFPMSLTRSASRWLRNEPASSITTWDGLKTTILNKYCPPARTAKKMEEINNFQQEPDENLYQAWERFKELLMKCPQHYLTEMQEKWNNGTSRSRSTETSDGLAVIQAQLNNLGREIKKVNEKVYAAQVGCEQCKGSHYTKDCSLKEEGKTLEQAYYTQFGGPFQGGGYRAAAPGFYQRNNVNPSYQERRESMEDTLSKFMSESTKRHEENSHLIKEI
ncbi:pyruvate dehydrogenase (acetyl-transferring) kinase, mitochondrial [Tanacetum coccineum]